MSTVTGTRFSIIKGGFGFVGYGSLLCVVGGLIVDHITEIRMTEIRHKSSTFARPYLSL